MPRFEILPPEKKHGRSKKAEPNPLRTVSDAITVDETETATHAPKRTRRGPGRPPKRIPVHDDLPPEQKPHRPQLPPWRSRRYCANHFDVAPGTWDRWVRENPVLLKPAVINGKLKRWTDEQLATLADQED